MRIAAGLLSLFLAACGSSGPMVDASEVGAPFSWAGGGFTTQDPDFGRRSSTEEVMLIFENVSERPQTVDTVMLRQTNQSTAPLHVEASSARVNRMVDPGEELEVTMLVRVTPQGGTSGAVVLGQRGVALDITLRHADGTSYRYPILIPMRTTIPVGP